MGERKETILLAGGAGYIGSHTAVELIRAGYEVVIADNYDNSSPQVIDRIEKITAERPTVYEADVRDTGALERIFSQNDIAVVIHFAGLKAVGESVARPLLYYRNNIDATLSLLEVMKEHSCRRIVFSSSATVYGGEGKPPYTEDMPKGVCSNPYGWTKSMMEQILTDVAAAEEGMTSVLLRYFNPIGADATGLIGEDPQGIPNNLLPFVSQVAIGRRDKLIIFGDDYPTPDGTCRRDYIHVSDLAEGHVAAVRYALSHTGMEIFNLGTGTPYSVLEIVHAFEKVNGIRINYEIGARRDGDLPDSWADAGKAERILGWKAKRSLEDMCRDAWNWQKNNPYGYE